MKRLVLTAALSLALSGPLAFAQEPANAPPPPPSDTQGSPSGGMHHHPPNPHREAMMLAKRLNLSADQTSKIEPILADRESRMEALRANTSLAPQDRHQQMKAIHEDTESKMASVLTPDQLTQLKAMRQGHGEHRGPGGSDGPPPPPTN